MKFVTTLKTFTKSFHTHIYLFGGSNFKLLQTGHHNIPFFTILLCIELLHENISY